MRVAFGSSIDVEAATTFIDDIVSGHESLRISILENNELNGGYGALDRSTGTIYLAEDFLLANSGDPSKISAVLLEEFGHLLDAKFNPTDALGDEGAIFSRLVTGTPVTEAAIAALQSENDHGAAIIDGKAVPLEFAAAYGTVTLDGSLADWSAANRLDTPADGVAGYEVYGQYTGNAFVFALRAPAGVAIGANTTFWLNSDQNTSTGHQIWGFAGGAEYNVNIGADGKLALYSGAAGQTLVSAAIDYSLSADGTVLEFAVPSALLTGAPHALNAYIDVNDQVFLSQDYANVPYKVAEAVAPPTPTVHGAVTLDGSLADWSLANRLDTVADGVAGYEVYGQYAGNAFVFALRAPTGVKISANTTFWLNTDQNTSTGYQIWGFAGGAEYNVNIGSDGKAALYAGAAGQILVSDTIDYTISADGTTLEFAVPSALLEGSPRSAGVYIDVNDQVFLSNDYANTPYTVAEAVTPPAAAVYGLVTLDGILGEWTSADRLDKPGDGVSGYEVYGRYAGDAFVFALKSDGTKIGAGTTFWLNTDQNTGTGYQIFGFAGGAEYNVNIGSDGKAALYTGAAGEVLVSDTIDYKLSNDGTILELAISSSLLSGAPRSAGLYLDVNDQVFLSNSYANVEYKVAEAVTPPPPAVYGAVTIDGDLADWTAATRLDKPSDGVAGYEVHGQVAGGAFVFALKTDGAKIGPGTTFWLNTDQNAGTGYQIWGFAGGAEHNVNIGPDGKLALYKDGAGQTLVDANIDYRIGADGTTLEFAVPISRLDGAPRVANVLLDVNDQVFLSNDYANTYYRVAEPVTVPDAVAGPKSIAIVYSETTAKNFYDLTAYSQLFMATQHQAMQAGIPFDILSETDLKDAAKLATYSTLVFPGMSHVKASDLAEIDSALRSAVFDHHVGIIAAGNFLTNDETGAALAGDSYARMKAILGVTLEGYGASEGILVHAADTTHPLSSGYAAGETVGTYGNTSFLDFKDVTGSGRTLFTQEAVSAAGNQTYDAVIVTQTGGRNVHFVSDAVLGNSNILQQAIEWSAMGTLPGVKIQMTRGTSLFAARNDMDQSQETFDVVEQSPGIYDAMNKIVAQWHQAYNFVGSYYINVGNNPPDQTTNWAVSKPYYDQLLALGSEIGTHSYTHPHDTNVLTPAEIEFEFNQSKLIIEQNLGIKITGTAVPGAPEKLPTSLEIIKYFDYMSGGFSGQGAGYPGAFGYLTSSDTDKVYLAPNMSFDFTVIQWLGLTPEQAAAYWAKEYASITSHASTPIIVFPWHDYGPTTWNIDPDNPLQPSYSLEMFTGVLDRAYKDGTEFVTLGDLAQRIESFEKSGLSVSMDSGKIVATVTSADAGHFALDLDQNIASVSNWYAYDKDSVFLPKNGGTFTISLGDAEDVTHISSLPMRADLLSVSGNGSDLSFSVTGSGDVGVDLRAPGSDAIIATGADKATISQETMTLSFSQSAKHTASIGYVSTALVIGTDANDTIFGGTKGETIVGLGGNDVLYGGGGADAFVFSAGFGNDTVMDFDPLSDLIHLVGTNFTSADNVLSSFSFTSAGAQLSLNDADTLLLNGIGSNQLTASNFFLSNDYNWV